MGQLQNPLEGEEVIIIFEEPQAAVGAIQNVIDQAAGCISGRSRHGSEG